MNFMTFIPDESRILLYAEATDVTVLGPGRRYVIWVQGCHKRCVGCISESSHSFDDGTAMLTEDVAERILKSGADGITLSGGEPMLQAAALVRMIDLIKSKRDMGVIIYTGYRYEELVEKGTDAQMALLSRVDILIDGEYRIALDDGKPHRGSSNQRILYLTERYASEREGYYRGEGERLTQEVMLTSDTLFTVGIPERIEVGRLSRDPSVLASKRIKI